MSPSDGAKSVDLSVVIAAHNAAAVISLCLGALEAQSRRAALEIILADSSSDGTDGIVRRDFPGVTLIHIDEPLGVPQLRGRGIAAAAGDIIAILDPFSIADQRWAEAVIAAHASSDRMVIGGVVDLYRAEEQGLWAWAVYLNEYGMFMSPAVAGDVAIVPGSNVSYKRSCLFDGGRPRHEVFWKTFINWEAARGGSLLRLDPSIRVSLNKPIPFREFFRTRSDHGRCFAGSRLAGAGRLERLARAVATPLIPLVLCARWTRIFWPKRRRRGTCVITLPLQLALFCGWAWGELRGCLSGPGQACQRLYY